jgi:hypothetical protein
MSQARNIFSAFELFRPERGDERILDAVEAFGCVWERVNKNVFYLHGELDAEFVGKRLRDAMNMDAKLAVIDFTKNDARWSNIKP